MGSSDARYESWFKLSSDTLQKLLNDEDKRASALEEKSAKISVVLGVGLTIGGTIGKTLVEGISTSWIKPIVFIGLLTSMLYLIWGGWLAFRGGMTAKPRHGYGADWELEVLAGGKTSRIAALIQFEKMNIIRNNDVSVAVDCVRNGLVVFALVILMVLADPLVVLFQPYVIQFMQEIAKNVSPYGSL